MVEFELFGDCLFYLKYGKYPKIPVTVETNLNYSLNNNMLQIHVNKPMGYVSLIYDVGTLTISKELKKQNFGKIKIDYLIIGD